MIENPWKFRKSSDIEMEVLFRRAENVWNEAIAARDKEWVEWFESYCTEHEHLYPNHKRSECSKCWQERKKEIGL